MQYKLSIRNITLLIMIVLIAAMRIPNAAQLTPWANFSPIGAMAIFGGSVFIPKWKAYVLPLATLLLSDIIINTVVFQGRFGIMYSGWYWIYGAFVLLVIIGRWMVKKITVINVLLAALSGSMLHWAIADFSVWLGGGTDLRTMLPLTRDWQGLMQSYWQGLPYFKNFLMGTIVYSSILFGAFTWMKNHRPSWIIRSPMSQTV